MKEQTSYEMLAALDVSKHVEKKGQLSYLSWAWAVDQLLRHDVEANWSYGEPIAVKDGTMLVVCTVTAFGRSRTMQLPIMDHRNKAIANPDSFAINTAMMRCLVKAIALHGLGLYIYAGEDLPLADEADKIKPLNEPEIADFIATILSAPNKDFKTSAYKSAMAACAARGDLAAAGRIKESVTLKAAYA